MLRKMFLPALLIATIISARAEDMKVTYRVLGMCTPDRQNDLREAFKEVTEVQVDGIDYDNGECTLHFDLGKFWPGSDPKKSPADEKILERIRDRLNGVSHGLFTLKARAALPKDKMQKIEIKIGILDCKACRLGTYYSIANMDGVEQVNIASDPQRVYVWIDASKIKREAVVAALKNARVDIPAE